MAVFWAEMGVAYLEINKLPCLHTSSIYYTTHENNPWICRYRFNGRVSLIFSVPPLIHVKKKVVTE
jgi:hypothetical protein